MAVPVAIVEFPDDDNGTGAAAAPAPVNQDFLDNLEAMGFPRVRFEKALGERDNSRLEQTMEWLFTYMDDSWKSIGYLVGGVRRSQQRQAKLSGSPQDLV